MPSLFRLPLLAVALAATLTACSPPSAAAPDVARTGAAAGPAVRDAFAEPAPGIAVRQVPGTHVDHSATPGYFGLDGWTLYPAPGSSGTPLVALVMDGSNEVTHVQMRIGRSTAAADLNTCTQAPDQASGPTSTVDIGGVRFTRFSASDAAMSHYLSADSYRAVQHGACYAIDLITTGTRPDVYDPPRTPPFTQADAEHKRAALLAAVYWTH